MLGFLLCPYPTAFQMEPIQIDDHGIRGRLLLKHCHAGFQQPAVVGPRVPEAYTLEAVL